MTLDTGFLLNNRYRIERVIAHGGMGAIYDALDESLGVRVAIKENLFSTEESTRQFKREATMLASLRHPNLPRVTDHFVMQDNRQYLVMDYIEGEDLRQLIEQQKELPEQFVLTIGITICDALSYLHTRHPPIVHRDIKPGNIKITPNGQIFLVDFGLAKYSQAGQATTTGAQALTPGFAPPEQYGQGTVPLSDIYSLGATLYTALTGHVPEDGLARAVGQATLTPVHQHRPDVSILTAQAIEKAMEIQPADRFANAEEFKNALVKAGSAFQTKPHESAETRTAAKPIYQVTTKPSHFPSVGALPSQPKPVASPHVQPTESIQPSAQIPVQPYQVSVTPLPSQPPAAKKPTALLFALGGIILTGICLVAGILLLGNNLTLEPSKAPTLVLVLSPTKPQVIGKATETQTPPQDTPAPESTVTLTTEPTQTFTPVTTPVGGGSGQIAYASNKSGIPQVYILNLDGSGEQQLTNFPDGACQPDWSPDGTKLVFTSPCTEKSESYKGSGLFIVNVDGSGLTPLITVPGGDYDPVWSPNGNTIAFTSLRDGMPHIYLYNLADNSVSRLSSPTSHDRRPAWSADGEKIAFETTRLGNYQVWIMNADGTNPREFANFNSGLTYMPTWAHNGKLIVFILGNHAYLISKQLGGVSLPEVKLSDIQYNYDPAFSFDDKWLLFEHKENNNSDIYYMLITGGKLTRLTTDPAIDFNPVWRPPVKP